MSFEVESTFNQFLLSSRISCWRIATYFNIMKSISKILNSRIVSVLHQSRNGVVHSRVSKVAVFSFSTSKADSLDIKVTKSTPDPKAKCGPEGSEEEEEEMEDMFVMGPSVGAIEWNGPTRGGSRPEPTRYGDWERKGRISDF